MAYRKGFSLVEIIVVLVVIAIAAAFILPNLIASSEQTKAQAARNNLLAISAAQQRYFEDNNDSYCTGACGNSTNLISNLHLSVLTSDPFSYSCIAAGSQYSCTAIDTRDTLTLSFNNQGTGVSVSCAPVGSNCPF